MSEAWPHKPDCRCQICASIWFVNQKGEEGLKNIGHFFKTGEMNVRDAHNS